ncbi:hypothetical protein RND81_14G220700 [Saponaria officinalis]|uniref:MADS-box domain-containing protein n=1 Tax=Saponaria officinalis TaxID=3572 RepID=A0AAW1GPY3_SAPOF
MATIPLKKNKGRQKVTMELMKKNSNRLVTFSKRRVGLFKKASELCTLCGAEVAILAFSPANKAYSFGHPKYEAVANRFLNNLENPLDPDEGGNVDQGIRDGNAELMFLSEELETERKRTNEILDMRRTKDPAAFKFTTPVEELTLSELKEVEHSLQVIREQVHHHVSRLVEFQGGPRLEPLRPMPMPMPLGDPAQMSTCPHPLVRGPNDNPPLMMVPTPRGVFEDPSLAMMGRFHFANFPPSSFVSDFPTMTVEKFDDKGEVVPPEDDSQSFMGPTMGSEGNSSAPFNPQGGEAGTLSARFMGLFKGDGVSSFILFNPRGVEGNPYTPSNRRGGEGSSTSPSNRQRDEGSSSAPSNRQGDEGSSSAPFNPQGGFDFGHGSS